MRSCFILRGTRARHNNLKFIKIHVHVYSICVTVVLNGTSKCIFTKILLRFLAAYSTVCMFTCIVYMFVYDIRIYV